MEVALLVRVVICFHHDSRVRLYYFFWKSCPELLIDTFLSDLYTCSLRSGVTLARLAIVAIVYVLVHFDGLHIFSVQVININYSHWQFSSDLENEDVTINTRKTTKTTVNRKALEKNGGENKSLELKKYSKERGEETPPFYRKETFDAEREESDSVESLKEIGENKRTKKKALNNNRPKLNVEILKENGLNREEGSVRSNIVRNSESEKEMEVKDSFKKKKRKKKVKRRLKKDLPPVLVKSKRPLPQLDAVDEEVEQGVEI